MRFLLDTDAVVHLLRRLDSPVARCVRSHDLSDIGLSSISMHELYYGSPHEVGEDFRHADFLGNRRVVMNVGGNKYRLVVDIRYDLGRIYVRHILTHEEYDRRTADRTLRASDDYEMTVADAAEAGIPRVTITSTGGAAATIESTLEMPTDLRLILESEERIHGSGTSQLHCLRYLGIWTRRSSGRTASNN